MQLSHENKSESPLAQDQYVYVCPHCDWVTHATPPVSGVITCERCHHRLTTRSQQQGLKLQLYGASALLMFAMSFMFSFIGFSAEGIEHKIHLQSTITVLLSQHFILLGILISVLSLLPLIYLVLILYTTIALNGGHRLPGLKPVLRSIDGIAPWLMMDVFLVGILVALIKLHGMAEVELGLSFWPFCLFVVLLIKTLILADPLWMWQSLFPVKPITHVVAGVAKAQNVSVCHCCGAVSHGLHGFCPRCGVKVAARKPQHQQKTIALLITAIVLFFPANLFPIMGTSLLGQSHESTIIDGVILLWYSGSYPIALVVLIASVIVPIFKILLLAWLCWQNYKPQSRSPKVLHRFYIITEVIGRWSMIDIFVVAVLSALVQMGNMIQIIPGPAIMAFASVVFFTIFAAQSFDPRDFWQPVSHKENTFD